MQVSQAAINAGMKAGRTALQNYSSFDSAMVPDAALLTFVTDVLKAGFGTVPANTIMGPGAHPHPTVNPPNPSHTHTISDPSHVGLLNEPAADVGGDNAVSSGETKEDKDA